MVFVETNDSNNEEMVRVSWELSNGYEYLVSGNFPFVVFSC